jgi:hypothetical protein
VGDGADDGALAGAYFLNDFMNAVLTDYGEVLLAAGLAAGIEDAEGAGISGRRFLRLVWSEDLPIE